MRGREREEGRRARWRIGDVESRQAQELPIGGGGGGGRGGLLGSAIRLASTVELYRHLALLGCVGRNFPTFGRHWRIRPKNAKGVGIMSQMTIAVPDLYFVIQAAT